MNDLYRFYLKAFWSSTVVNPIGEHQFSVPATKKTDDPDEEPVFHMLHYDGKGLPKCSTVTCEAARYGMPCKHMAAVVAFVHPEIQRLWDHRRIFEARHRSLLIRQGKVNPRRHPRIRKEMERINERHPVVVHEPTCTSCGGELTKQQPRDLESEDLCDNCYLRIEKIWSNIEMARLA